jgi:general secretion pathway protein A
VSPPPREAPQYEEFYGLVQSPFTLAPYPRFLYLSQSHDAALQQLLQAIERKEGIVVLIGDIGTGKTTICRSVLERLDMTCFTSLLLNPFLSVEELLREILLDFGVVSREAVRSGRIAATKHDLVSTLHEFLVSLIPIGGSGVLIIDEAQHLSPGVLEELRVLSNLETNHSKLLQIVLVGQLKLLDVLRSPDVKQLDQRITMRATLNPLTRSEVDAYIGHRLSVAHGSSSISFDSAAIDAIHAASRGVPRMINLLCDRSLMIGARFGLREIPADVVSEAVVALGLPTARGRARAWRDRIWRFAAVAAVIVALIAALLLFSTLSSAF